MSDVLPWVAAVVSAPFAIGFVVLCIASIGYVIKGYGHVIFIALCWFIIILFLHGFFVGKL